jgi:hypothetical protein
MPGGAPERRQSDAGTDEAAGTPPEAYREDKDSQLLLAKRHPIASYSDRLWPIRDATRDKVTGSQGPAFEFTATGDLRRWSWC